MKKLIIASFVAALFAACNNTPAVSESATKVASLGIWVDSVKNLINTATTHDSASWAGYNTEFEAAVAGIKMEELDEATKATLETAKTAWAEAGTAYTAKMTEEKAAAMAADTTKAAATVVEEVKAEVKAEVKK